MPMFNHSIPQRLQKCLSSKNLLICSLYHPYTPPIHIISNHSNHPRSPPFSSIFHSPSPPQSPQKKHKTYLNNNMPRQPINNHMLILQPQRLSNLLSQFIHIPFYFPYAGLVQVSSAFGEVVDGEFLRGGAVDVVGEGGVGGGGEGGWLCLW